MCVGFFCVGLLLLLLIVLIIIIILFSFFHFLVVLAQEHCYIWIFNIYRIITVVSLMYALGHTSQWIHCVY